MKKAVAGLWAAVMLLSSALAVDTVSFSDEDQITYRDAVLSLCQVGIINGKDDGTFDPKGSVTRAEAAKMIATYVNGAPIVWSSDPAFIGTPGYPEAPTFNDIGEHWAMRYIEYCAAFGLINGVGDGSFDPQGEVTHREFAKMTLAALGYDAETFGLSGVDWEINVNTLANSVQLFDGLEVTDGPAAREEICQILNNALSVAPLERKAAGVDSDGNVIWEYTPTE